MPCAWSDFSSPEAYNKSIEPNRKRLAHILGVTALAEGREPGQVPEQHRDQAALDRRQIEDIR